MQLLSRNPAHEIRFRLRCRLPPVFARGLSLFAASNGRAIFFSEPSASSSDCPRSRDRRYGTTYSSRETIHSSKARCSRSKHSATISFSTPIRVITGRCRIFPTWSITFSGTPTQPVFILATFSCTSALACCSTGCSHCFFALTAGLWNNRDFHRLDGGALVAFLISGLWMVHPVHSAAVDYISGRADSLAFLFSAGAWLLVLRGRGVNSRWLKGGLYFAAALSGLLGLCSREIACIWIFVFLVHTLAFAPDMRRRAKIFTRDLLRAGPFRIRRIAPASTCPVGQPFYRRLVAQCSRHA